VVEHGENMFGDAIPTESEERRVRKFFEQIGGAMSTAAFARLAIERGVWTQQELDRFNVQAAQARIRRYLKKPDASGLPFAGQTVEHDESDAPIWKQRFLWDFEDYDLNVRELASQVNQRYWNAIGLINECRARYGRVPEVRLLETGEEKSA
jgi:hypothetical protein